MFMLHVSSTILKIIALAKSFGVYSVAKITVLLIVKYSEFQNDIK